MRTVRSAVMSPVGEMFGRLGYQARVTFYRSRNDMCDTFTLNVTTAASYSSKADRGNVLSIATIF
jgi:hypothetical protein